MTADTTIAVLVPTAGRPELLRRTLTSLVECERPPGFQRAFVLENGERGGAEEAVADLDRGAILKYRHVPWPNKSNALNEALNELADDTLAVFFDDDVRLDPLVLTAYSEAASRDPQGCFYGGAMGCDYEVQPPDWLRRTFPPSARGLDLGSSVRFVDEPVFLGCNWAVFVRDLRRIDGFDTNFGPGSTSDGQETTAQRRLLSAGLKGRYVPKAFVWHYVPQERSTPEWVVDRYRRNGRNVGSSTYCSDIRRKLRRMEQRVFSALARLEPLIGKRIGFAGRLSAEWRRGFLEGQNNREQREAGKLAP